MNYIKRSGLVYLHPTVEYLQPPVTSKLMDRVIEYELDCDEDDILSVASQNSDSIDEASVGR